jgi:tripartite-type tricarboxylate transporter receptor subunit TctC
MSLLAALKSLLALTLLAMSAAHAQEAFPSQRIEIVVPLTPGSAPDTRSRTIGERRSQRLGQPVVVTNKPGAATQIAMAYLKRAAPDGHTLMLMHSGMIATGLVYKAYDGNILKDHTFVSAISTTPYVLAVNRDLPVATVVELAAYAKANPAKLNFASTGGAYDIDALRVQKAVGFKAPLIPYAGGTQMLAALAANEVQVAVVSVNSARNLLKNIRLLAVASPTRFSMSPELPTLEELGYPNVYGGYWYGFVGPAGMPAAVTQRLNHEINQVLKEPAVQKRIVEVMTNDVLGGAPADLEKLATQTFDAYRKAAVEAGIHPQ